MAISFDGLGVAAVHEGLDNESTLMSHEIAPRTPGTRMWGRAITVLNAPGDNLALHRALALAKAGDVLVVGDNGMPGPATWGGMVTQAAVGKGLAGAVIDGAARDLSTYLELSFPVWSRLVCARRATKTHLGLVNEPVVCGGVLVHPGDYVVGDEDGVVVVPQAEAQSCMERALGREERETALSPLLRAGQTPYELMNMADLVKEN